jgi:hypothetical protein
LAFPGNPRIGKTIWQPTEVWDGDVEGCEVEEWLQDGLENRHDLIGVWFFDFLTIIEILSRSLAGWWQENAAETLLPRDQHSEISATLAKLCALGSNIYPQGLRRAGGGAVCANQIALAER